MKRVLITLLSMLVAIPLFYGGLMWFTYQNTDESSVPLMNITMLDEKVAPNGYEWYTPVFGGTRYKEFFESSGQGVPHLGTLTEPQLNLELPLGFNTKAVLTQDGAEVWSGAAEDLSSYTFVDNGEYRLNVECKREAENGRGYGSLFYNMLFNVTVDTRVETGGDTVAQGGVLALRIVNLSAADAPTAECNIGPLLFYPSGEGQKTLLIPVGSDVPPGEYKVRIQLESRRWDISFFVTQTPYKEESRTFNTRDPAISEAISPLAQRQLAERVAPLYETGDEARYWQGAFAMPTEGNVATAYGTMVYSNNARVGTRHNGVDIAAPAGAAVVAPAPGRVVMAEFLLNTGNTVVIEHGGGLKSYLYHMDMLTVAEGAMVAQGDVIGTVGTTGDALEPHLHFETRIFHEAIDPIALTTGTCGLFYFDGFVATEDGAEEGAEAASAGPVPGVVAGATTGAG